VRISVGNLADQIPKYLLLEVIVIPLGFLLLIACGVAAFVIFFRRRTARTPQIFIQPPLASDQVPMLAPPKDPFTDAAAPASMYPYAQNTGYAGGYAQNSGGYAPNIGYSNPYPPAASYSNVSLVAYQQDPKLAVSFFFLGRSARS
jgi:hypothetical protein